MSDSDGQEAPGENEASADDRGRVTFLDPAHMTDEEIENALAYINDGMPEK